jgi:hypothetical protein
MVTYKVKLVSQTNAIVLLFILLVAFFIEAAIFFPLRNQSLGIPLIVLEFAFAIFLWQKFVTGWTEWQVDKDRITISWIKKFAFSDISDYVFEWKDIEKIWKGMDTHYYNLKFKFTNQEKITFYHASFGNDDFSDLLKILYQTLDERKKATANSSFAKVGLKQ